MLRYRRLHVAAIIALAIFASASSAQTTLRYRFKEGDDLQYVINQKMKMNMSVMGMDIETKMNMTLQLSWTILKVESSGNAQVRLKVTHAKLSMDGVTGNVKVDSNDDKEPEDAIGKIMHQVVKATSSMEITSTILPTGEMKDGKISDATAKALKNIPGAAQMGEMVSPDSFKAMVNSIIFPSEAVTKGKTWSHKTDIKSPIGKTTTENVYTYDGTIEQNKVKLDKISLKPKITVESNPDAPAKIEVKDAKGTGTILFDNQTGRVVESTTQQTTQMALNANGIDLMQTIEQTTTMKLKKK